MQKCLSILSRNEINEILQNPIIEINKTKLLNENLVKFSISLPNEIKTKLENELSIHLSDTVPIRWVRGDTAPHIDKGDENFENTYLIYLTDSNGSLIIDSIHHQIIAGNAHIFSEGLEHSTINTTNERLIIGPMSENGFEVGIPPGGTGGEPGTGGTGGDPAPGGTGGDPGTGGTGGDPGTGGTGDPGINIPISNICFPKDTPILTDQGIVKIQDITNETIYGLKVEHITQTTTHDTNLVCFEKDSISIGFPTQRTIMSRKHKVFHGTMVNADSLLKDDIYLIPYNGEILYNVLLEQNGFMVVNNLVCETLDVNNIIALFYKSNYTVEEKNKIITLMNDNINNEKYKELSYEYFSNMVS